MLFYYLYVNFVNVLAAVVIDWIVGDPRWFPHPVIFMGRLIRVLEKSGRKYFKSDVALKCFGGFIVIVLVFVSFEVPFLVLYIFRRNVVLFSAVNILLMTTALSARCLDYEASGVYCYLKDNDMVSARKKLSFIVGRDTENLEKNEVIRAAVETVAENTSDGVIAPLFYGFIFGAPLAMAYKAVNTMDSMLGYMNEKYRYIGFFPAKVDDVFNFIPARISGFLIGIVSPLCSGSIVNSLGIMIRDRKNHKSPNCAYPEAAVAGALNIQLGGTNVYFGKKVYKPTIGDNIKSLECIHIKNTIRLMYFSEVMAVILEGIIIFIAF